MKQLLLTFFAALAIHAGAQSLYFPPLTGNAWDTVSPSTLGWCPDKVDSLIQFVGNRNSKAFIVLKDGKIVIEEYYGTFTADSLWYWASAGKTLTAFTVGIAQQEGYFNLSDTTSDYLGTGWTACTPAQEEKITIWHQLTMTSGLDDGVPDHYCTLDTCLQYEADAGTRWAYHNGPYTLLDGVITTTTGMSLNQYVTQKVKTPTGMTGFFFQSGYNNLYLSNARSMARFGLLLLNRGVWNTTPVLNDTAYFNQMVNTSQPINPSYGYLTWLNGKSGFMAPGVQFVFPGSFNPSAPADMICALGKNGQFIDVVPSQNIVLIRMGNTPWQNNDVPFTLNDTIWQKLNEAMCSPQSISNAVLPSELSIYPNPAIDMLNYNWPGKEGNLTLFDCAGRVVWQQTIAAGQGSVPVSALPAGVYMLQMRTDDYVSRPQRVLISR
ncbi:MAG: serine hydrolase [Bacteroidia bacterium]|jgi:CubicO group peptidase (beta-lactamase class C family)|nr:serine hydrolase [Bacteroidia bacterium]